MKSAYPFAASGASRRWGTLHDWLAPQALLSLPTPSSGGTLRAGKATPYVQVSIGPVKPGKATPIRVVTGRPIYSGKQVPMMVVARALLPGPILPVT